MLGVGAARSRFSQPRSRDQGPLRAREEADRLLTGSAVGATEFAASLDVLGPFEPEPLLAVAVSGGPDSMALALLAQAWARARRGEAVAITVDHGLRPESAAEAHLVGRRLTSRGMRHCILRWTGDKPTRGLQQAAREARYRLLDAWCATASCLHLLVGHQQDDQIETHLLRKRARSGRLGLAGMAASRELAHCRLLRPLLAFPRDRLLLTLAAAEQPFIDDPSNCDPRYERSRVRAVSSTAPERIELVETIRDLAMGRIRREAALSRHTAHTVEMHSAGFAVIDPDVLGDADRTEVALLLSRVVSALRPSRHQPRGTAVDAAAEALFAAEPRARTLGGCRLVPWRARWLIFPESASAADLLTPERDSWPDRWPKLLRAGLRHASPGRREITGLSNRSLTEAGFTVV